MWHRGVCWLLLCAMLGVACDRRVVAPPRAAQGVLDLRGWDFDANGPLPLDGEWLWYWQRLLSPAQLAPTPQNQPPTSTGTYPFPRNWNGLTVGGQPVPAEGYATFRLRVLLPRPGLYGLKHKMVNLASLLWLNDRLLTRSGTVATEASGYREQGVAQVGFFSTDETVVDLTLQIANFGFFRGGPRAPILLGTADQIAALRARNLMRETALLACSFIIGVYQVILFLLRRRDRGPLYLGIFCLLHSVWIALQGELILTMLLPMVPYDYMRKIEYLTLSFMPPVFLRFVDSLYPELLSRSVRRVSELAFLGFATVVVCAPANIYTRALITTQITCFAIVVYMVVRLIYCIRRNWTDYYLFTFGCISLAFGVSIDIINIVTQPLAIVPVSPFAVLGLMFTDAIILARKSARAHATVETQALTLERVSRAYYRFVPQAFLHLLGKQDITTVELGDQTQRTMTVLFADVRGFTTLSEKMTPEENFTFINRLLRDLGPLIRAHNGFIDKYMGDGIMALFPQHPADALRAACAMRQSLRRFNASRHAARQPPIKIGIGLHTGSLMLGTVGEPERMDGTVIADAVNTASRLESLTKRYGVTILASEDVIQQSGWSEERPMHIRPLGRVRAKGKSESIELYEVFDDEAVVAGDSRTSTPPSSVSVPGEDPLGDSAATLRLKQETRGDFAAGLRLFQEGRFAEARDLFAEIATLNSHDQPASYYAARCAVFATHGAPPDWDGIEALTEK